MKHLGDIKAMNGYDIEPVDVITGGSPCQDLSVAGKRAGLAGERSGLFMEQIRIIKEMRQRERDSGRSGVLVRPRYCIWENVPGAFSSNGGKDFQAVLTEFVKVCEPDAPDVPMPDKWPKAGVLYSDVGRWSVAYKLHDAQYWGVPQRRRRLCVLADFNGLTAGELLFDPQLRGEATFAESYETEPDPSGEPGREVPPVGESLSGHPEQGEPERKATAGGTGQGTPGTDSSGVSWSIQGNTIDRDTKQNGGGISVNVSHTLDSADRHGVVTSCDVYNQTIDGEVAATVTAAVGGQTQAGRN